MNPTHAALVRRFTEDPDQLTDAERAVLISHCLIGVDLNENLHLTRQGADLLKENQ